MSKLFQIDGRNYRVIERTTIANDFYVMKHMRESGLSDCTPKSGESPENFGMRLLYSVVESGISFELLGGLLLPEEIPDEMWSPAQSKSTGVILSKATAPEDKAQIQKVIIELVSHFFVAGLRYSKPSPAASAALAQPGEMGEQRHAPHSSKISTSGAKWFARWRTGIRGNTIR